MQGWVTWLSAIIGILSGVAGLCTGAAGWLAHNVDPTSSLALDPQVAMTMIGASILAIQQAVKAVGIGRKLDKVADAVKETKAS